jgi:hypothetical protein
MAANNNPIFILLASNQWPAVITAANTAKDGTGTVATLFTADTTNGGYVNKVIAMPLGTNVATVLRIFLNNGSSTSTALNNIMIAQVTITATTNTEVAALPAFEIPINLALAPGYKLTGTIGTAISAGLAVSTHGGAY